MFVPCSLLSSIRESASRAIIAIACAGMEGMVSQYTVVRSYVCIIIALYIADYYDSPLLLCVAILMIVYTADICIMYMNRKVYVCNTRPPAHTRARAPAGGPTHTRTHDTHTHSCVRSYFLACVCVYVSSSS